MKTGKWIMTMLAVVAIGLVTAGSAWAGNLTPSHPPAPTMHTLEEIYQQLLTTQLQVASNQQALADMQQRMAADGMAKVVGGMVLVPAGSFDMGDCFAEGGTDERPRHTVTVSAFYMDQYVVTKAHWDEVYNWAVTNDYSFANAGLAKGSSHPVHTVNWYDCVKWCNARSQKEGLDTVYRYVVLNGLPPRPSYNVYKTGERDDVVMYLAATNGYRLPTEAEWEKAARGGATGRRFPWSGDNTIQHARANYNSTSSDSYDTSATRGYHPSYTNAPTPHTSPVGSFSPNGYGLYDMAGNVREWCWDWRSNTYYSTPPATDPNPDGPPTGTSRVLRGGSWAIEAESARCASRGSAAPDVESSLFGFRCARGL